MPFFLRMCPALPLVHRQESVEALVLQHGRRECDYSQNLTLVLLKGHTKVSHGIKRVTPFARFGMVLSNKKRVSNWIPPLLFMLVS